VTYNGRYVQSPTAEKPKKGFNAKFISGLWKIILIIF